MAAGNQQLGFAIRALNEASKALKDVQRDLGDVEKKSGVADRALAGVGSALKGIGGVGKSAASALGDVAKIAGGFVLGQGLLKAPGAMFDLSKQAATLDLTMRKVNTVFGEDLAGDAADWANEVAHSMGLTRTQAQGLAAGMADLLIPMGMTREQAFELSTNTIQLSGALAEWTGGQKSAAEVSDILTKAYLGETDGLKALGISISASDVAARLAAQGQEELEGAARQQAEALVIQQLIMEKSVDAQRAFAEGGDSAARKQAEMSAKIQEAKERLATGLQPAFLAVTKVIYEQVVPALDAFGEKAGPAIAAGIAFLNTEVRPRIEEFAGWLRPKLEAMGRFFMEEVAPRLRELAEEVKIQFGKFQGYYESDLKPAIDNVKKAIAEVVDWIRDHWSQIEAIVRPIFEQVANIVETQIGIIKNAIQIIIDLIGGDFSGAWKNLKELVGVVMDGILESVDNGIELIKGLGGAMLAAAKWLGEKFMEGLKDALSSTAGFAGDIGAAVLRAVKGAANSAIDQINGALRFSFDTKIPGVGSITIDAPDIPHLATGARGFKGGYALVGEEGPELVRLPAGADVYTASQTRGMVGGAAGGGGGLTVIIEGSVYGVDDLMYTLDRALRRAGYAGLVA